MSAQDGRKQYNYLELQGTMEGDDLAQSRLFCGSQEGEWNRKNPILEPGGMGSSSVFTI